MSNQQVSLGRSWWVVIAGLLGATAVALGAFHAHGMEKWLEALVAEGGEVTPSVLKRMEYCETGLKYQLVHAVALFALGIASRLRPKGWAAAGFMLTLGTLLFSGSLYGIAFLGITKLGMVAPLGGLSLIIGWVLVAVEGARRG